MHSKRFATILTPQNADTKRIINAMPVRPGTVRQSAIDAVVKQAKAYGLWSIWDTVWAIAAHESRAGLINWKNPGTYNLVPFNSPTFTVDRGYQGDGVAAYLQANGYNPTVGGGFSLNSAMIGAWIQQASTIASARELAIGSGNNGQMAMNVGVTGYSVRLNDATNLTTALNSIAPQHLSVRRTSAAGKDVWRDGVQKSSDAVASTAMGLTLFLLSTNGPSLFSNGRLALAYVGSAPNDMQMAQNDAIWRQYMKAVGVA